jgi:hypothetical protein
MGRVQEVGGSGDGGHGALPVCQGLRRMRGVASEHKAKYNTTSVLFCGPHFCVRAPNRGQHASGP